MTPLTLGAQAFCLRVASIVLAVFLFTICTPAQDAWPLCAEGQPIPPPSGCSTFEYDRFKDSTMASLRFLVVDKGLERRTVMMFLASFSGRQPRGAVGLAIGFISTGTKVERAILGRELELLIDGNSRSKLTFLVTGANSDLMGLSSEQLLHLAQPGEIEMLLRATTLEMRLGTDEFVFTDTMRANLQKFFAAYISLPAAN